MTTPTPTPCHRCQRPTPAGNVTHDGHPWCGCPDLHWYVCGRLGKWIPVRADFAALALVHGVTVRLAHQGELT